MQYVYNKNNEICNIKKYEGLSYKDSKHDGINIINID
jgi:hypothetical protein